jgi:general secretion pathway protein G
MRNNKLSKKRRSAFTLVEVVVVIVILVSLAGIATPIYMNYVKQGKISTAQMQIKLIEQELDNYKIQVGKYPSELRGLVENVDSHEKWDGPYMKKIPLDPWGNEYQYTVPGENNTKSFDLCSLGADGQTGGDGEDADITNWAATAE